MLLTGTPLLFSAGPGLDTSSSQKVMRVFGTPLRLLLGGAYAESDAEEDELASKSGASGRTRFL
jgi:hypothetical protein